MKPVDRQLGEFGEQEARHRLERALHGTGKQLAGHSDLGLDLIVQYPSPSVEKEPLIFGVQVKTGNSFAQDQKTHWKIKNLDRERFRQWQKVQYPVLFVWVRPTNPSECYWGFVKKSTDQKRFLISKHSQLSPTAPYDFAREFETNPVQNFDDAETFELLRPPLNQGLRSTAKNYFKKTLQGKKFSHPVLGPVCITQNAWRHITRKKRPQYYISQSLQLLPTVQYVIENSTKFVGIRRLRRVTRGSQVTVVRLLVFRAEKVRIRSQSPKNIQCVLRECVTYPVDWLSNVNLHQETSRHLSLESIYEKPS